MRPFKQLPHNEYYELDAEERAVYNESVKRLIQNKKEKQPVFEKMLRIVEMNVEHYEGDFFLHDYNSLTIENQGCTRFVWLVHNSGTHLVKMNNDFTERKQSSWNYLQTLLQNFYYKSTQVFIIDLHKNSLTPISEPSCITLDDFKDLYGNVRDYFDAQVKTIEPEYVYPTNMAFKRLLEEYRGLVPKSEIDELMKRHSKKGLSI